MLSLLKSTMKSIREIVKKKKFLLVLLLHLKLKVMATAHGKYLVNMEKALNLWVVDMNRERPFI